MDAPEPVDDLVKRLLEARWRDQREAHRVARWNDIAGARGCVAAPAIPTRDEVDASVKEAYDNRVPHCTDTMDWAIFFSHDEYAIGVALLGHLATIAAYDGPFAPGNGALARAKDGVAACGRELANKYSAFSADDQLRAMQVFCDVVRSYMVPPSSELERSFALVYHLWEELDV